MLCILKPGDVKKLSKKVTYPVTVQYKYKLFKINIFKRYFYFSINLEFFLKRISMYQTPVTRSSCVNLVFMIISKDRVSKGVLTAR